MNAETDAILQICMTLPKLKLASVTLEEDNCRLSFLTYNAFKGLNYLLMNKVHNGFRLANLPYEVSLSVSIPLKIYEKVDWDQINTLANYNTFPEEKDFETESAAITWRDRPSLL